MRNDMGDAQARDRGPRWGILLLIALVIGGGWFYMREQEAQRCREAFVTATNTFDSYGGDIDAALALIQDGNRRKARDCYTRGLIDMPP